jgi:hypothetical protein
MPVLGLEAHFSPKQWYSRLWFSGNSANPAPLTSPKGCRCISLASSGPSSTAAGFPAIAPVVADAIKSAS